MSSTASDEDPSLFSKSSYVSSLFIRGVWRFEYLCKTAFGHRHFGYFDTAHAINISRHGDFSGRISWKTFRYICRWRHIYPMIKSVEVRFCYFRADVLEIACYLFRKNPKFVQNPCSQIYLFTETKIELELNEFL